MEHDAATKAAETLRFLPENRWVGVFCAVVILCVGTYVVRGYIQALSPGFDHFRAPHLAALLTGVAVVWVAGVRRGAFAGVVTLSVVLSLLGLYQVIPL